MNALTCSAACGLVGPPAPGRRFPIPPFRGRGRPLGAYRGGMAVLLTTLAGMVIASRFDWPRFVEVLASAFAILVVMCFGTVLLAPRYGIMTTDFPGAWRGVWDHKNALGYNMTVGFVVFVAAAMLSAGVDVLLEKPIDVSAARGAQSRTWRPMTGTARSETARTHSLAPWPQRRTRGGAGRNRASPARA